MGKSIDVFRNYFKLSLHNTIITCKVYLFNEIFVRQNFKNAEANK